MSEMVERVAKAIRKEISGMGDDSAIIGDGEHGVGNYMDIARAAIEAMQEPTEQMIDAAYAEVSQGTDREQIAAAWRAMVHTALLETSPAAA